jgi:uncharacterized FAD-dependent dehydrogenase
VLLHYLIDAQTREGFHRTTQGEALDSEETFLPPGASGRELFPSLYRRDGVFLRICKH